MKRIIVTIAVLVLALGAFSAYLVAEQPYRVYTGLITSSVSGAATIYVPAAYGGMVHAVRFVKPSSSPWGTTTDFVITGQPSGIPVLTWLNVSGSGMKYPRAAIAKVGDAAAVTSIFDRIPIDGDRLRISIAQTGVSKIGSFYVWFVR